MMRSLLLSAVHTARNSSVPLRAGRRIGSICFLLFCISATLWAQQTTTLRGQQTITGKVSSAGAPLSDVTVTVDGSNISTKTNDAGAFSITAPTGSTLLFTHIGYAPKKVPVSKNGIMAVQLETASEGLNDVVVVGYGTTKKSDLISSVGSISGKELTTFKDPNAANSLQGEVPGVRVLSEIGRAHV